MASRGFTGVMMKVYGAKDHLATVVDTEFLAPHFVRVRMRSRRSFKIPRRSLHPPHTCGFGSPTLQVQVASTSGVTPSRRPPQRRENLRLTLCSMSLPGRPHRGRPPCNQERLSR